MKLKKSLSLVLAVAMVFWLALPAAAADAPKPKEVYAAIMAMKDAYPEGTAWTGSSAYTWKGGIFTTGYGASGFAFMLSDAAFGELPARMLTEFAFDSLKCGDILRMDKNTHSVVVLTVAKDTVEVAEGDYQQSVHWGRILTKAEVMAADYVLTRYPDQTHVHDYAATQTVAPTCTEAGYTVYTCTAGDDSYVETVNALGHDWGEWSVILDPTETAPGVRMRVCSRDSGHVERESIPATGKAGDPSSPGLDITRVSGSVTWRLKDGTLTILLKENGPMPDYDSSSSSPWYEYRSSVKKLELLAGVSYVGSFAFCDMDSLKEIALPQSVTEIGSWAFQGCDALEEYTVPGNVRYIDEGAFSSCAGLKKLTLSEGLVGVSDYAFRYCAALEELSLPLSLSNAGRSAFAGCSRLSDLYFAGNEEQWGRVAIGEGNEALTQASIHFNGDRHRHNLIHIDALAATEAADGNSEYWYCPGCGKYYADEKAVKEITLAETVIPKLQHRHELSHIAAVPATEAAAGSMEYWFCPICGKYFADEKAEKEISLADTVVPKLEHIHSLLRIDAVPATEVRYGNIEYWFCPGCGKYFADEKAQKEITLADTVVPMLPHSHTLKHVAAAAASCTEPGIREHWICTVCEKLFADAEGTMEVTAGLLRTDALGHSYVGGVCSRCGQAEPTQGQQDPDAPGQPGEEVHFLHARNYTPGQFTDVSAGRWFAESVASAYELGLMQGFDDGTFQPDGQVTVAQAITMAARIHSIYSTGTESFDQSAGEAWYSTYLDYAYRNGIISLSMYRSDAGRAATRAEFAEIFAGALPDKALFPINSVAAGSIPDVSDTDSFSPYVYKLYRAGILTGNDEVTRPFLPKSSITRAEASAIVSRMADSGARVRFSLGTASR